MELIQEPEMWDSPSDGLFVEAFWETLAALYKCEAKAAERGGSRKPEERFDDLNEDIRRALTRAKTRTLLREVIADLFAKPVEHYRAPTGAQNPAVIWRLIDQDWKRARDLALLALVSYQRKETRRRRQNRRGHYTP